MQMKILSKCTNEEKFQHKLSKSELLEITVGYTEQAVYFDEIIGQK